MKKRALNYSEGTLFAVPLRDGGFGWGVISRLNGEGVALGYFFGPRYQTLEALKVQLNPSPQKAVLFGRFGDLGLVKGTWPILENLSNWRREEWPMPAFVREVDGELIQSKYDEALGFIAECKISSKGTYIDVCKDSVMGYGFVEVRLTKLLSLKSVCPLAPLGGAQVTRNAKKSRVDL